VSVNWQDDSPGCPGDSRGSRSEQRMTQRLDEDWREIESSKRMVACVLIAEMIMLFSCGICGVWMWFRP